MPQQCSRSGRSPQSFIAIKLRPPSEGVLIVGEIFSLRGEHHVVRT
jgi:hypothetical protein